MTICGEIDLYTAPRLHSELGAVLADGMPTRIVIDMSGVEFCDSTGMNVLLSCLRRVRERGGELEIASPKPAVRKILQVTGLDSVFTLVDDANLSRPKPAVPQQLGSIVHLGSAHASRVPESATSRWSFRRGTRPIASPGP